MPAQARTYGASMSLRPIFAMFVALAVLLAPAFSPAGKALAAGSVHHGQTIDSAHCQSGETADSEADGEMGADKSCCISMCMGVALPAPMPAASVQPSVAAAMSRIASLHLSHLGEIATPPPKFA